MVDMKRILVLITVVFLMVASLPLPVGADADTGLSFASIFGDGMVLQQNRPVQVFGFGREGDAITLTLKRGDTIVTSQTAAVSGGRWNVVLPAQSGSFDAYSLEAKAGSEVRTLENLVFGEVWIAGGQSNMEWTLAKAAEAADWEKKAHTGKVRFFVSLDSGSSTPQNDVAGYWITAVSWEAAQLCSAIGYMFGYTLSDTLGVPVGIVNTAQGSTRLPTWIGQETIAAHPDFSTLITTRITPKADDGAWDSWSMFYHSRISPMRGYQAAGILWYQGEAEIERGNLEVLRQGIPLLVEDWSAVFGDGETLLPFLSVQVASFSYRNDYLQGTGYTGGINGTAVPNGNFLMNQGVEEINRAYGKALSIPIYDVEVSLSEIHPPHKEPVAAKLLDASLGLVYGKKELYSGPRPISATFDGKTVEVVFANVGDGLKLAAGEELLGFRLDGAEAKSAVEGPYTVSIPAEGQSVSEVSYAFFTRNQGANLTNSGGYVPLAFKMPVERVEGHPDAEALAKSADRPGGSRGSGYKLGQILLMGLCVLGIAAEAVLIVFLLRRMRKRRN